MNKLEVYYDGLCIVCATEIDAYRRKDTQNRIQFVDITHPQFDAKKEGLDPKLINRYMHVKTPDGRLVRGVDSFVEIWKTLEVFSIGIHMARIGPVKKVMDFGYEFFSRIRPYLPKKKNCDSHHCDLR